MSERDRLVFRIEFEADEEGLQQQVEEAVHNAKPRIEGVIQEILENMGIPEVQSTRPTESIITKELKDEISILGQRIQDAMEAWDMTMFQAVGTQRTNTKTVGDLIHQLALTAKQTRESGGEIGPMVSAVITNALGSVVDALTKNPGEAQRLLGSEIGSITRRQSIYGELTASIKAASEVLKLAIGFERGLSDIENKAAVRDWLASSISKDNLKQLAMAMFKVENPDAWIKDDLSMEKIFGLMGVNRDEALKVYRDVMSTKRGAKEEDIESGFESFLQRRIDYFAVNMDGITMGRTRPIADTSVAREVQAKTFENEIVQRLLDTHSERLLTNLERLKKSGEEVPRFVGPYVRGELTAFGATKGIDESINITEGWRYKEIGQETIQVSEFNWGLTKSILEKSIKSMTEEGALTERQGEHLLSAISIDDALKRLDITTSEKRDPYSTSMTDETLRVEENTSKTDTSIPTPVKALLSETKEMMAALLQIIERIADKFPEEASTLRGIIGAGRTIDFSEGL